MHLGSLFGIYVGNILRNNSARAKPRDDLSLTEKVKRPNLWKGKPTSGVTLKNQVTVSVWK